MNNFRQHIISELGWHGISKSEAMAEADLIIEHVSGLKKKDFILNPDLKLTDLQEQKVSSLVKERISKRIPVQYLLKEACFMGEKFYVNENILIPRPETEILVKESVNLVGEFYKEPVKILDIGTGSGCIACMLAKLVDKAQIIASDISEKALEIAKTNAKRLNVENKVTFAQSDILSGINEKFDIIVSNPPYISKKERENLQIEVSKYEPALALFVDDEKGISFYKKLIDQSTSKLNPNGFVAVEIGISQSDYVKELFAQANFVDIKIIKDLNNINRVIIAKHSL